jgi:pimeloyl-ACP methyl ester carboxylesterase
MPTVRRALLVHGSGGGAWEWALWRPVLERAGWTVSALELQPVGAGLAETTVDDYVSQVTGSLAAHSVRAAVVGASMGGLLALAAAAREPVRALVLVNPVPPAGTPGWPRHRVRFPAVVAWGSRSVAETLSGLPDADPAVAALAPERWRDESGQVMHALYRGVAVEPPRVPTLVLVGGLDDEVPSGVGLALSRHLGADALRLSGVSHLGAVLGRRAPEAARLAAAWLETAGAAAPAGADA